MNIHHHHHHPHRHPNEQRAEKFALALLFGGVAVWLLLALPSSASLVGVAVLAVFGLLILLGEIGGTTPLR
jgi:hypothetical protein